jgi:DnaK suppressor protein
MDTNKYKQMLETEKNLLESELENIGIKNPNNPEDWQAVPSERGEVDTRDETAVRFDNFEEKQAAEKSMEKRWHTVKLALEKIERGDYGICEISGQPIEEDRLEANPAARTNKANMNKEEELLI